MKYSREKTILIVVVALAVLCSAQKCDPKKETKKINIKAGKALIACKAAWKEMYKAESIEVGAAVIEEYKGDPAWTDEMAEAEFRKRMASMKEHSDRFEEGVNTIALSQEALEAALAASDDFEAKKVVPALKDVVSGLTKLVDIVAQYSKYSGNEKFRDAIKKVADVSQSVDDLLESLEG